jgi:hypothetical protein
MFSQGVFLAPWFSQEKLTAEPLGQLKLTAGVQLPTSAAGSLSFLTKFELFHV